MNPAVRRIFLVLLLLPGTAFAAAPTVRPPAVAGRFYPADAATLKTAVHHYLQTARKTAVPGKVRGLVSPHAGYVYSGVVAGAAFRHAPPDTRRVILIGSSHRAYYRGASIPDVSGYETPLGIVPLSPEAAVLRNRPGIVSHRQAHREEHSLEVQLPFLQAVLGEFELIPLLLGQVDPAEVADMLSSLIDDRTLVVASTDLSHYHPYDDARALDAVCTGAMETLSLEGMERCEACGRTAVMVLMHIAVKKGWGATLLDCRNSGDTAGPKDRVVGYAAVAFSEEQEGSKPMSGLTDADKKALIDLARSAIRQKLSGKAEKPGRPEGLSPAGDAPTGCFVTLHKRGALRGCIGSLEAAKPLAEGIVENAENAAFRDPRFPPLTLSELDDVDIEISVLSRPTPLAYDGPEDLLEKLKPGVHGVILSKGWRRSTFLPQVWDQLPDKRSFLEHLCRKAGLGGNCWKDPSIEVKVYEASYFGEKD